MYVCILYTYCPCSMDIGKARSYPLGKVYMLVTPYMPMAYGMDWNGQAWASLASLS